MEPKESIRNKEIQKCTQAKKSTIHFNHTIFIEQARAYNNHLKKFQHKLTKKILTQMREKILAHEASLQK